jgi:enoyl-CoA hydratase/carnithine racemase
MSELVLTASAGGVATVTLNRAEKRNALSIDLRRALADAFDRAGADADTAVVVVTGAGTAFCAGMDRSQFGGDEANRKQLYSSTTRLFDSLARVPVPVIAAVNGPALGGGSALAALCDVRLAAHTATFGHPEISFGVPPSYAALLLLGLSDQLAREFAFTGRIVGAEEALALGIVRGVHDDVVGAAVALAGEMSAHGRTVLAQTKRIMIDAGRGVAERAWQAEMELFRSVLFKDGKGD